MVDIINVSGRHDFTNLKGVRPFSGPVQGLVIHHTGGGGGVEGVLATFAQRTYPAQFVIDRNGLIYQTLPTGYAGRQIKSNEALGLSNANTIGVEVIAADDRGVNPEQIAATKQLYQYLSTDPAAAGWGASGLTPDQVYGHGVVNPGHKQATEGMTIANAVRAGFGGAPYNPAKFNANPSAYAAETPARPLPPAQQAAADLVAGQIPGGPVLRKGATDAKTGGAVTRLQQQLADAGFDPGPVDGKFGKNTEAAVRAVEKTYGLTVEHPGKAAAGPQVQRALANQTATSDIASTLPLMQAANAPGGPVAPAARPYHSGSLYPGFTQAEVITAPPDPNAPPLVPPAPLAGMFGPNLGKTISKSGYSTPASPITGMWGAPEIGFSQPGDFNVSHDFRPEPVLPPFSPEQPEYGPGELADSPLGRLVQKSGDLSQSGIVSLGTKVATGEPGDVPGGPGGLGALPWSSLEPYYPAPPAAVSPHDNGGWRTVVGEDITPSDTPGGPIDPQTLSLLQRFAPTDPYGDIQRQQLADALPGAAAAKAASMPYPSMVVGQPDYPAPNGARPDAFDQAGEGIAGINSDVMGAVGNFFDPQGTGFSLGAASRGLNSLFDADPGAAESGGLPPPAAPAPYSGYIPGGFSWQAQDKPPSAESTFSGSSGTNYLGGGASGDTLPSGEVVPSQSGILAPGYVETDMPQGVAGGFGALGGNFGPAELPAAGDEAPGASPDGVPYATNPLRHFAGYTDIGSGVVPTPRPPPSLGARIAKGVATYGVGAIGGPGLGMLANVIGNSILRSGGLDNAQPYRGPIQGNNYAPAGTTQWGSPQYYTGTSMSNSPFTPAGAGWNAPNFSPVSGGPLYSYQPNGQGGGTYIDSQGREHPY